MAATAPPASRDAPAVAIAPPRLRRPLYRLIRALVTPVLRGWFRLSISGAERLPREGAVILAPNHKSFLDAFFLSMAGRRPLRFMAKVEIFKGPAGPLLRALGAFPVRRGETDAEAMAMARAVLEAGEPLVVFPEGTRVDEPDALGSPHHGAGRLALETGAPILPTAIAGTSHLWFGPIAKPRHVRIAILEPVPAPRDDGDPEALAELIDQRVWPAVQQEYGRLQATPGVILTALTAIGLGAGLIARRQRRAAPPRLLGIVPPLKARRRSRRRALAERLRRRS